ncbi:MAG TPA: hypothetical protein VM287_02780 [Egibacteraceae bacterium]|nr:hypothetical protein [Egibacteraceae bacterium]
MDTGPARRLGACRHRLHGTCRHHAHRARRATPAPPGHPFALRYAGQVGSGLSEFLLRHFGSAFKDLATVVSPFIPPPPVPPLNFVRPNLVVEVMFNEMTTAGVLRQPSIKGLRNDVDPGSVAWTEELQ